MKHEKVESVKCESEKVQVQVQVQECKWQQVQSASTSTQAQRITSELRPPDTNANTRLPTLNLLR